MARGWPEKGHSVEEQGKGKALKPEWWQVQVCLQKAELVLLGELLQLRLGQQKRSRFMESCGYWSRRKDSRVAWKSAELCGGVCMQTGSV